MSSEISYFIKIVKRNCTIFACYRIISHSVRTLCYITYLLLFRWNPKKRMTPDEALRHDWMQTASSHKQSDLRHSHSEVSVGHQTLTTSTVSNGGTATSNDNYAAFRLQHHHKISSTKATIEKLKTRTTETSRIHDSTSVDSNLNDSGTFLPPIL